jgi:protein-tyrosine phosphatase
MRGRQCRDLAKYSRFHVEHGVVAVISAGRGLMLKHSKHVLRHYLYLPLEDNEEQDIQQYFGMTFDFIESNRERGNVLVHCYLGVSRSTAIVAAYLIRK